MAVLQKLRGWGIVLSILVALPLLLFIIDPSQVMQALQSVSSKYDVGNIAGKSVSYTDFQGSVEALSRLQEMMTGSSSSSEQQQKQIRDAAWQSLLDEHLFLKNARAAGITVGKDEMVDLTSGDAISPILSSSPFFNDENGNFSKEGVVEFLRNVEDDQTGNMKAVWEYLQKMVYTTQYYTKYNALFSAGNFQNALMTTKAIEENNNTADVEFVMVPYSFVTDSTIVVSSKEISSWYNDHKKFYRQQAGRDIEYVVYQVVPSEKDITEQSNAFTALYDEFVSADNVRSFLQRNSDRQYSDTYYKAGELASVNKEVDEWVAANNSGTSPIFRSGNSFFAAKVLASAMVPDEVYVRHILLQGSRAKEVADSLKGVLANGGDFSTLATLYSADKGSADGGERGNIGWLSSTRMIPGFESVMTAKVKSPFILDTNYGTHIVEVTEASEPVLKKKAAIFEKETIASQETFNQYYNQANKLATLAGGTLNGYRAAVDSMAHMKNAVAGTYSHPMTITEATDTYGSIGHAKEVTRWAFDNKPGKVSNIITVDNNYFFVVAVKAARKEGFAKVEDVSENIKNQLYAEKYGVKRAGEIAAQIAGIEDLAVIADTLGTTVSTQNDVAFAAMSSRSLDPKFVGAIASAPEGKICGPVAGSYGVYVFKVTGRETGSFYTEDDAANSQRQLASYMSQMILPVMMEDADVKDNRARFY